MEEMKVQHSATSSEDTQSLPDKRDVPLDLVGITGFQCPATIAGWEKDLNRAQSVVATISLGVDLDAERKGVHLSRLMEVLLASRSEIRLEGLMGLLEETRARQGAGVAEIELEFTYFLERRSPVTQKKAMQGYRSWYRGRLTGSGKSTLNQVVEVPVMTLCPCSKAISDYGAHNQRAYVTVTLNHEGMTSEKELEVHLEEVVEMVEESASSPLYPLLKRADERYVTMSAYDHPVFTEDVARNVVTRLRGDQRFDSFKVSVVNEESIHNHSVQAVVQHRNT